MYANRLMTRVFLVVACVLFLPWATWAVQADDPHRIIGNDEFQETIEGRCTSCHSRDRVDKALGKGEELDSLLQRMIERGAVFNERDRSVLGTFWGSPSKGDKQPVK